MRLNIVLVEPEIPQNTGNIARTCAATGTRLHLVEPLGFEIDDRKLKRAGLDYWKLLDISNYTGIKEFYDRTGEENPEYYYYTTKFGKIHTEVSYKDNAYLIFGSETRGLSEDMLRANQERCIRLPMITEARSLNLSNTVAVGVYEVLRQWGYPELENKSAYKM